MGTPLSFFAIFSKGDNFRDFLFVHLEDKVFPKWDLLVKKRMCSDGSKFFPLCDDPNLYEATMKMTELLPLKVYPFILIRLLVWN